MLKIQRDNLLSCMTEVFDFHTMGRGENYPLSPGFLGDFLHDAVKADRLTDKVGVVAYWVWSKYGTEFTHIHDRPKNFLTACTTAEDDILAAFKICSSQDIILEHHLYRVVWELEEIYRTS